jgi:hypothetical protein
MHVHVYSCVCVCVCVRQARSYVHVCAYLYRGRHVYVHGCYVRVYASRRHVLHWSGWLAGHQCAGYGSRAQRVSGPRCCGPHGRGSSDAVSEEGCGSHSHSHSHSHSPLAPFCQTLASPRVERPKCQPPSPLHTHTPVTVFALVFCCCSPRRYLFFFLLQARVLLRIFIAMLLCMPASRSSLLIDVAAANSVSGGAPCT